VWQQDKIGKKSTVPDQHWFAQWVLGDMFLAQNNSGKLTIRSSVFLCFQFCDIENLIW
jgi:hypothetical protein